MSVVMPVHNVEGFVRSALTSILNQTFSDFEVIVVDDGSKDGTAAAVREIDDPRVRLLGLNEPTGDLGATLNAGLELARGEYVARMDGDDLSYADRFRAQVALLDAEPALGLVGTWADFIDERGDRAGQSKPPVTPGAVAFRLHYESTFHHPSVMFRRALVEQAGGYRLGMAFAEDYDLWARLAPLCDMANIPEILFAQRVRSASVSSQYPEGQARIADDVGAAMFSRTTRRTPSMAALRRLRTGVGDGESVAEATHALVDLQRALSHDADMSRRAAVEDAAVDALLLLWRTSGRRAGLIPLLAALRIRPSGALGLLPSIIGRLRG